jgi:hypothetical protein
LQFAVQPWTRITDEQLAQMRKLLAQKKTERAEVTLLRRFGEERAAGRELATTQNQVRDRTNIYTISKDEIDGRRAELDQTIADHEAFVATTDRKISALKIRAQRERQLIAETEKEIAKLQIDQNDIQEKKESEIAAYQRALEQRNFLEDVWREVHDSQDTPTVEALDGLIARFDNLETQNYELTVTLGDLSRTYEQLKLEASERPLKETVARLENEALIDSLATKKAILSQTLSDSNEQLETLALTEANLARRIGAVETGLQQIFDRMIAVCPYASRQRALAEHRSLLSRGEFKQAVAVMAERIAENRDFLAEAKSAFSGVATSPPSREAAGPSGNVQIVRGGRGGVGGSTMSTSRSAPNSSKSITF